LLRRRVEAVTDAARREAAKAKHQAEQVERELANMSRERLLPGEKTLEKITRYEAHLSRQMFKALHELEAFQVRRSGGAAPLARLDVDGISQE
jgi:CRISPR/Cas system-associated endonuclease Cas1